MNIQDGAAIRFAAGSTAEARQERGRGLATELKIQAAKTGLARAATAIQILVAPNVGATKGAAENDVLFIYGVVSRHLESKGMQRLLLFVKDA